MTGQRQLMSIEEIRQAMESRVKTFSQDEMAIQSSFERNEENWRSILKNTGYDRVDNLVRFDVWSICEFKDSNSRGKISLSIKSKLNSSRSRP